MPAAVCLKPKVRAMHAHAHQQRRRRGKARRTSHGAATRAWFPCKALHLPYTQHAPVWRGTQSARRVPLPSAWPVVAAARTAALARPDTMVPIGAAAMCYGSVACSLGVTGRASRGPRLSLTRALFSWVRKAGACSLASARAQRERCGGGTTACLGDGEAVAT